ncbi:MAG: hypothetical protein GY880_19970 [Planctomycetaceae bacterium]|nr:hypothetical protein [Planctomycetaceae bacterium]
MAHESERIRAVHRYLPKKEMVIWKIADSYHRGIADAYYSGVSDDLWVEYKSHTMNQKLRTRPKLSSLQIEWLDKQYGLGRNVWVIMLTDKNHHILKTPKEWNEGVAPWAKGVGSKYPDVATAIINFCHQS